MTYSHYLKSRTGIPDKRHEFYLYIAREFKSFIQREEKQGDPALYTGDFLLRISASLTDWQVGLAREAVNTYLYYSRSVNSTFWKMSSFHSPADWKATRQKLVEALRTKHRSPQTEKAYLYWFDQLTAFTGKSAPEKLSDADFLNYISFLAVEKRVASATQNQAFNALLFFYRHILGRDPSRVQNAVRATLPARLPEVLSRNEIRRIFSHLIPRDRLICGIIYGGGLRLNECLALRIKDVDLNNQILFIRQAKGSKDRRTLLSPVLLPHLKEHLVQVRDLFDEDRVTGNPGVLLPGAYDRKHLGAETSWPWYWLFPASKLSVDPRTNLPGRFHLYPTTVQRAFKRALERSAITRRASVHTLRHSFATHMIEDGYDVRTVQELLGHASVNTTMVYTHIAERNKLGARSPLNSVWG